MLQNIFVISTLFAAVYCTGELSVLYTPPSVEFKPCKCSLESEAIGSLITAALGKSIYESTNFKNVFIKPFDAPDHVVLFYMNGGRINYQPMKTISYPVTGNNGLTSIESAMERVREDGSSVLNLDLSKGLDTLKDNQNILGELNLDIEHMKCGLLTSESTQKHALEQIAAIAALARAFSTIETPTVTRVDISFAPLMDNSKLYNEAIRCYIAQVEKFTENVKEATSGNVLFLSYVSKNNDHKRSRRAAEYREGDDLNLAKTYDENYPVIFNIILWFGVVIAFSLYAICYAIATMDPGRDSIIYRMTSTRIKKDN